MTPLDDELRSMFSARADVLSPAADPLAGIERRAKRMRRNRVAASVAGTALAVSALAVAVPSFLPEPARDSVTPAQTPTPSVAPSPTGALHPAALDPQNPWEYRGDRRVLGDGFHDTLLREWAVKHPGSTVKELFGQVYEPSRRTEVVFVSTSPSGDRWGVATSGEGGPDFPVDEALPYGSKVLMAALPGDEVPRLLVVGAPSLGAVRYAKNGTTFRDITLTGRAPMYGSPGTLVETSTPGIGVTPLEGDTSRDVVQLLDGDGDLDDPVFQGPAPDAGSADDGGAPAASLPDNLVPWHTRGAPVPDAFWEKALAAYARGVGAKRNDVEGKVLFAGNDDAGNRYVFGQAWILGNDAHTFGYSEDGDGTDTPFLGPITDKGPSVLAFLVPAGRGQTTDTLVVVPEPVVTTTYYGQPQSEWIEIVGQGQYDGVTLIDRQLDADGDLLKLTTADGTKVFEGPIQPLLCGVKECG